MSEKKKSYGTKRKRIILICVLCLVAVLVALVVFAFAFLTTTKNYNKDSMFQQKETLGLIGMPAETQDTEEEALPDNAIVYNGETYLYNENIVNLLFIGVDARQATKDKGVSGHQADTLIVVAIDTVKNEMKMLNIPRDSLTQIKELDVNYNYTTTSRAPIALAHSYGDGAGLSAMLTTDAVSNLLYGVPIYRYLAMNIDGIGEATDLVGGVTLTLSDDFTKLDKTMEKGKTMTLNGKQAVAYVQQRALPGMGGENLDRMPRQVQYFKEFFKIAKQKTKENITFPVVLITELGDYITTNMSLSEISYVAQLVLGADLSDENIMTAPGTMTAEGYVIDEEGLKDMVREVFYVKSRQNS